MLTGTRRTVLMLAGCQALSMTGGSIVGLTGAIVGNMLTPDKALSTLPIAVQQAGVMVATIPAALLMARFGRRPGFWLGTAIGGVGLPTGCQGLNGCGRDTPWHLRTRAWSWSQ